MGSRITTNVSMSELNLHLADSTTNKPLRRINNVLIVANLSYVPVDFTVMDIESHQ